MYHSAGRGIGEIAGLEEKGDVPDMMQSEGDERALDHAVDGEGDSRALMHGPVRKSIDDAVNWRPHETEDSADPDHGERGDNRN